MQGKKSTYDVDWYYDIKEIDRRLSYFLVGSSSMVCDVGGARGMDALSLAKLGAYVIDLDIDRKILYIAKKYARKHKLDSKLCFVRASATNLPFRNGALDLVTCFSVLDHLPDRRSANEAVHEFSRVVRRFGYVAITVPNKHFLIGTVSMRVKYLIDSDAFFEQRFTPNELQAILTSSGLSPIIFDSKYPTSVGPELFETNLPMAFKKIPMIMKLLSLGAKLFSQISKISFLKLFGARVGYLSQKR